MIKHDFSFYDLFGRIYSGNFSKHFYDKSKTNAQILREFYQLIQSSADKGTVINGCNVSGHLSTGIHQIQRTGEDTSGRSFQLTRLNGIHNLMRTIQNDIFLKQIPIVRHLPIWFQKTLILIFSNSPQKRLGGFCFGNSRNFKFTRRKQIA